MTIEELAKEVQWLKDRKAIEDLMCDYWWRMDTKQWDKWADVFTDDISVQCVVPGQGVMEFCNNLKDWMNINPKQLEGVCTAHQGHQSMIIIHEDGKTATGRYILNDINTYSESVPVFGDVNNMSKVGSMQCRGYGYYMDDYRKCEDGKWRISVLRLGYFKMETDGGVATLMDSTVPYRTEAY